MRKNSILSEKNDTNVGAIFLPQGRPGPPGLPGIPGGKGEKGDSGNFAVSR